MCEVHHRVMASLINTSSRLSYDAVNTWMSRFGKAQEQFLLFVNNTLRTIQAKAVRLTRPN